MNERYKIGEAKFFLARMEESIHDRVAFRFNLSAFLSSARSVLQYALKESREKGRQRLYDETVSRNDVLRFFIDKRNVNIHEEPVNPSSHITIAISECVGILDVASVVLFNDKPVGMREPIEEPPPPKQQESRTEATVLYHFDDWTGPEDVIALSHRYIEALESFVQSGTEIGIMSG
jgi:hypothetical protein